jgi:hypothetical protein
MPAIPQQPVMGLVNAYSPLTGAGVGLFNESDTGFTSGTVIPDAPAQLQSPTLLVVGYNQFLFTISAQTTGAAQGAMIVQHCDPVSGAVVVSQAARTFPFGSTIPIEFGAGAFLLANQTAIEVYFVIRIALQGSGGAGGAVITTPITPGHVSQLYCHTK